jgi:lactoylglutathione lyase
MPNNGDEVFARRDIAGDSMQEQYRQSIHENPGKRVMTSPEELVSITGIAHVGIRVHDLTRSLAFYELLGFRKTLGPIGPEPVAILEHPSGIEINLVLNAPAKQTPNVLMDVPVKAPGITHVSLACPDIADAARRIREAGLKLSEGPVRFPDGSQAIFLRDPDGVVIELNQASS